MIIPSIFLPSIRPRMAGISTFPVQRAVTEQMRVSAIVVFEVHVLDQRHKSFTISTASEPPFVRCPMSGPNFT